MGGQIDIRSFWHCYFKNINGLIWVYDISQIDKLEESKKELTNVLNNPEVNEKIPLLIYANKNDLNTS